MTRTESFLHQHPLVAVVAIIGPVFIIGGFLMLFVIAKLLAIILWIMSW